MGLGTVTFYGNLIGFLVLFAVIVNFWFKSLQEEKLLTEHLSSAYVNYKTRVKAFIPFVY